LLASELDQLSLRERERVFEEVHGVAPIQEEDLDFVTNCLLQLEEEIGFIRRKQAYEKAVFLAPVKDRGLRLMFLRSVSFDPIHGDQRTWKSAWIKSTVRVAMNYD
jgi:hypothetical protein